MQQHDQAHRRALETFVARLDEGLKAELEADAPPPVDGEDDPEEEARC